MVTRPVQEKTITLSNFTAIMYKTGEADVTVDQARIEKEPVLGKLSPSKFYSTVCLIKLKNESKDLLTDMNMLQFTKLVNALCPVLATFACFHLSLERIIRRRRLMDNGFESYKILNHNDELKSELPDCATVAPLHKTAAFRAKEHLQNLTVALLHSGVQEFIIRWLLQANFQLHYDKTAVEHQIQPIWHDVGDKLGLPKGIFPHGTVHPMLKLGDFLEMMNMRPDERKNLITAVILLYHHRELDSVFQNFLDSIDPSSIETGPYPVNGASSVLIRITDQVHAFFRLPNVFDLNTNATLFSPLTNEQFKDKIKIVLPMATYHLSHYAIKDIDDRGYYSSKNRATTLCQLYETNLEAMISLALTHYVISAFPNTTWKSLLDIGFLPTPPFVEKQYLSKREKDQLPPPGKKLEAHRGILTNGYYIYIAEVQRSIPFITALVPGTDTLYERTQNIRNTAASIDRDYMLRSVYDNMNKLIKASAAKAFNNIQEMMAAYHMLPETGNAEQPVAAASARSADHPGQASTTSAAPTTSANQEWSNCLPNLLSLDPILSANQPVTAASNPPEQVSAAVASVPAEHAPPATASATYPLQASTPPAVVCTYAAVNNLASAPPLEQASTIPAETAIFSAVQTNAPILVPPVMQAPAIPAVAATCSAPATPAEQSPTISTAAANYQALQQNTLTLDSILEQVPSTSAAAAATEWSQKPTATVKGSKNQGKNAAVLKEKCERFVARTRSRTVPLFPADSTPDPAMNADPSTDDTNTDEYDDTEQSK